MGDKCIHLYLYKINYKLNKRQWYAVKYEKSLLDKASFCLSYRPPNDTNITVVWIME